MPLRRSPQLTPGSLAARRANALKSTGPRTARGKARVFASMANYLASHEKYAPLYKKLAE